MIRLTPALILALGASTAACGEKSIDDMIAELRGPAQQRVDRAAALPTPLPAATGQIALDGPPMTLVDRPSSKASGNTTAMFAGDLTDPLVVPDHPLRFIGTGLLNDCAAILAKRELAVTKQTKGAPIPLQRAHVSRKLPTCAGLRYLVVFAVTKHEAPKTNGPAGTFAPGRAEADVLVFNLATGAYLGGVPARAESSSHSTERALEIDLAAQFLEAATISLKAALPGATIDFGLK